MVVPVNVAIVIIIIVLSILWLTRKIKGEKGTWDKKKDIEEFATIMRADTIQSSSARIPYYENVSLQRPPQNPVGIAAKRSKFAIQPDVPIKNGSTESIGEKICRDYMENRFKTKFANERPDFLKNPITNTNLELDCFSKELKLAVEYNGKQHYEFVPRFHKNKNDFYNQKYRDDIKRRLCFENGVTLIEVPYSVDHDAIPLYLESKLQKYYV